MARKRSNSIPKEKNCKTCGIVVVIKYSRNVVFCRPCLNKNWRKQNSKKYKESIRRCYEQSGDKYYIKNKEYKQNRLNNDIEFRLKKNLRARVNNVIKKGYKAGSAVRDLGCSPRELKLFIESKWQYGMTWGNYGLSGWHIDHIIPLCKFNLLDSIQFKKAVHYTNLQPLWANDNWSKGGK